VVNLIVSGLRRLGLPGAGEGPGESAQDGAIARRVRNFR
jgi:hypothetical protein